MTSRRWALPAGIALLLLASLLVYWPALHGPFIWDDQINIDRNPLVRSDRGLVGIWTAAAGAYDYYPVTWSAWWLQWRAFGRETTGYHVIQLLLHVATCAALWRVLARLNVPGAFVAAMIFAVHPVNVETVAWISEQKNTLSLLLALTSLLLYLDGREGDGGRGAYWGSAVAFALALLAKPSVVPLPAVFIVIGWWRGRPLSRELVAALPMFALAAVISAVTVYVHHTRGIQDVFVRGDGFAARLAGAGMAVAFYLSKLVVPVHLSFVYPRWSIDPRTVRAWLPLAWLVVTLLLLLYGKRWWGRGPAAALLCYVLMLLPVLGFIDIYFMRFSFVADHWQYPACAAVIALLVATGAMLLRKPQIGAVVGAIVIVALGVLARRDAALFQSELELWGHAVAENPTGAMPKLNYGGCLFDLGRHDEALSLYREAIALSPDDWDGYVAMAKAYTLMNEPERAIEWYRRAARQRQGGGPDPRVALGTALAAHGDTAEAIHWLEQARSGPDADAVPGLLAPLYNQTGQPERALEQYRLAAQLAPDSPEDHFQFALALLARGKTADADAELAAVRRLVGNEASILHGFGARLTVGGNDREAAAFFQAALAADPGYTPSKTALAKLKH